MKTDSLFYRAFSRRPELLFELAEFPVRNATGYRFESVEGKQTASRIDGVFLPPAEEPDSPLIFAEAQYRKDQKIYARLFGEAMLFLFRNEPRNDWRAAAIFADETGDPGVPGVFRKRTRPARSLEALARQYR